MQKGAEVLNGIVFLYTHAVSIGRLGRLKYDDWLKSKYVNSVWMLSGL